MSAVARKLVQVFLLVLFVSFVLFVHSIDSLSLYKNSRATGWALFIFLCFLSIFSLRKFIVILPMGSTATWRKLHIWFGVGSLVLFFCHLNFRIPDGFFETSLALFYVLIIFTGVFGTFINKFVPRRLALHGKEILFERLPFEQNDVQERFEILIRNAVSEGKTELFSERFLAKLHYFFSSPRGLFLHLLDSRRPQYSIQKEIGALMGQVGAKEKNYLRELSELVSEKNHLDYSYVHQIVLKYWNMLHAPLAGAILIASLFHMLLVYAFTEI